MTYLIDTDILSLAAPFKAQRDPRVVAWLDLHLHASFLSVVSIWEMEAGCERLVVKGAHGKAKVIRVWIDGVAALFDGRVLTIDAIVAARGGRLLGRAQALGFDPGIGDALIAAQAEGENLAVASGNGRHFEALGVPAIDPRSS